MRSSGSATAGWESRRWRDRAARAYQLRDRASDAERFFIDTLYDRDYTGNLEREQRTWKRGPRVTRAIRLPHGLIAGRRVEHRQNELAIAEADKAIALDPDLAPAYTNQAFNQLMLNRLDDALLTVRRATERKLEFANLLLSRISSPS